MFGNLDAWDGMTGVRAVEHQVEPTFWEPVLEKDSTNDYAWKSLKVSHSCRSFRRQCSSFPAAALISFGHPT